jgi:hypothetical protein
VDPPAPRQGGDDQPLGGGSITPPEVPSFRPSEENLTERYGPVAPEPEWRKLDEQNERLQLKLNQRHHFNRERFLLRCVAWIVGVHFSILGLAAVACAWAYIHKIAMLKDPGQDATTCPKVFANLQDATNQGLAVLLALLGGGALATDEQRRARKEEDHAPADPRRGGGDQP